MTSAIQKDIITLDITMDNILTMKVGQTLASLGTQSASQQLPFRYFLHI